MIGVKKTAMKAKSKRKFVVFDRFSTLCRDNAETGTLAARESINCCTPDGVLRAGVGLTPFYTGNGEVVPYIQTEAKQFFIHKYQYAANNYITNLAVQLHNGQVYDINDDDSNLILLQTFSMNARVCTAVDSELGQNLLVTDVKGISLYTDQGLKKLALSGIRTSCVFQDRLYIVRNTFTLQYSAPLDFLNFEETIDDSGALYLPTDKGAPVELNSFAGKLYLFFEYGITEVATAGAARDFKPSKIPYAGGRIIGNSIGVFGDKLCFLAEDGVYFFDGKKTEKVYKELDILPSKSSFYCGHATCEGRYLLRYRDVDAANKTVVLYPDGEYGYFTTCMKGLSEADGVAYCVYGNLVQEVRDGEKIPTGEYRHFYSMPQDFGVKGRKTLKALYLEGVKSFSIDVYADGQSKNMFALFENGRAVVYPNMRGEEFSIRFTVPTGSKLWRMTAEVEYL